MRIPGNSEASAFHIAMGLALLTLVALLAAVTSTTLYGVLVFAVGALAALMFELLTRDPNRRRPLRDAARSPHPHAPGSGSWRVLLVANEAPTGPALRDEIVRRGGTRVVVDVLAPVLTSRAHHLASDYDRELGEARSRLESSLSWAASQGLAARGEVGDPDPSTAIEDELRDVGADEVFVLTHPHERANWLESGELERLREELDVPVTHVVVDRQHDRVEIAP